MDTAWHQTMPDTSFMYAVPYEWYEKYAVRRYGSTARASSTRRNAPP
jgi:acetate kinase